jgi:riboflavin synthase
VFTGLIQALGTLQFPDNDKLKILCIRGAVELLADIALGDSIAVNGVCLTVETLVPNGFIATASPETLNRSALALAKTQAKTIVNLESSLRVGSKIGGHFVTGHVDGTGTCLEAMQTENTWEISFQVSHPTVARYIVPKGSIAVDGISLTVADCSTSGDWFKVAVIPVTYYETNLQYLESGTQVNLEGDILGKYVDKLIHFGRAEQPESKDSQAPRAISLDFLAEHGYL